MPSIRPVCFISAAWGALTPRGTLGQWSACCCYVAALLCAWPSLFQRLTKVLAATWSSDLGSCTTGTPACVFADTLHRSLPTHHARGVVTQPALVCIRVRTLCGAAPTAGVLSVRCWRAAPLYCLCMSGAHARLRELARCGEWRISRQQRCGCGSWGLGTVYVCVCKVQARWTKHMCHSVCCEALCACSVTGDCCRTTRGCWRVCSGSALTKKTHQSRPARAVHGGCAGYKCHTAH